MPDKTLLLQNADLRKLLEQAGLDAAARDVAEQIQKVLTDEIHHRMKNMLTMVTAIVRQSMRAAASMTEAEAAISTRLIAMAKAHDLLLKADWKTASLASVIRGAIEQHNTTAERITIDGVDLEVMSSAVLPLTLMLNELSTNATKYGAFSRREGHVVLSWKIDEPAKMLRLKWAEVDGPAVAPPGVRSFGTRLLEEALPRQLGGTGRLAFPASGVEFDLVVPLEKLIPLSAYS